VLVAVPVYLDYGTLSPCGALRESVREQDRLARILPDGVVDAVIESNAGPLSPGRCLVILLGGQHAPTPTASPAPQPNPKTISAQANPPATVQGEMVAAINECKAKRLAGELKTYVESAQCSNSRILQAFGRTNYRYMDLITLMTAKRAQIAERLDRGQITEADANMAFQQAFSDIVTAQNARDTMRK
jgi:hypothetical protein